MATSVPQKYWPDEAQDLVLKMAMQKDPVKAWEQWCRQVDVNDIDWASMQMLPQVYKNLSKHGITGVVFNVAKGLHRKVWYRNQLMFDVALDLYDVLQGAGIRAVPLKGLALCIGWLEDPGLRQMCDVDFLVPEERVAEAWEVLKGKGWSGISVDVEAGWKPDLFIYRHAVGLINPDDYQFDLHWSLLPETVNSTYGKEVLSRTRPVQWKDREFQILDDEDFVFLLCVHGIKLSSAKLQWIADVHSILSARSEPLPWERIFELAVRFKVVLWLRYALVVLNKYMPHMVGMDLLEKSEKLPTTGLEQREVKFESRDVTLMDRLLLVRHKLRLERIRKGDEVGRFSNGNKPRMLQMLRLTTGNSSSSSLMKHYFSRFMSLVRGRG